MDRLDRIFIRAKDDEGNWQSLPLTAVNDEQFDRWFGSYIRHRALKDSRENCVKLLDHLEISPVELKEL